MRIDKFLANMGVGTRSEVKNLLKKGQVVVNDVVIKSPKQQIDPSSDQVEVAGDRIIYEPFVYLMLNKPAGVISATEDDRHQTVIDLIDGYDHLDLFPVGRLDKDTEGLLLITNDGNFNHRIMSPNKHVPKRYFAELAHAVDKSAIQRFEEGITLKEGLLQPAHLEILPNTNQALVTITEGKYHQVKRMFHEVDNEVVYLKREAIGQLELDPLLHLGEYRKLTEKELSFFD
ncbi:MULTISPECIES: pseudouridine synthase [unclassified Staphylococcus]|uniref:pseudouridine synthase n=1 Tax=unclassified Staphylococcus TaxID=91994 RepID=UPI0021D2D3F4|nr:MULTISPECIES: pseudouridine synthase [unclassified Staphylococcus]UXR73169.1 rRNA pseudouridine synthase [Staphylococcus sp. IVB6238]UXR75465.1 rRNA pseudouridine synthase [Staphylococcus sp. IVB6233]UXR79668.1 rRNA pseudouridine synthase [Staphylococcus sp. IVB6218]